MIRDWHSLSLDIVKEVLDTNFNRGLTKSEAFDRGIKHGKNVLPREKPIPKISIFLEQFKSPLIYILLIAGLVVLFFKEYTDAIVILGSVVLNTFIGYVQENKANSALSKLKKIVKNKAKVLRGSCVNMIDAEDVVPGDIIFLNTGDSVPADGRLIKASDLHINEMALTGEWIPAEKKQITLSKSISMADRDNMVYMGTMVSQGKGAAVVTGVGEQTEVGKVASLVKETREGKTPYQKRLSIFSKKISYLVVLISVIIFISGIFSGGSILEMFETAVAVAVSAIPEGLPIAMTVILALGMQRILKKQGLTRKLIAAETLGSTTIICTDKTATLTQGKISVSKEYFKDKMAEKLIPKIAVLCNEAYAENEMLKIEDWELRGQPTGKALLVYGAQKGFLRRDLEIEFPILDELEFNNETKYLASLHKEGDKKILFVVGAPEKLLEISKGDNAKWKETLDKGASQGLRMIGFGYKYVDDSKIGDIKDINFLGLIGMSDPIREDAKQAIKIVKKAGLKVVMITGDHKLTAQAVGKELKMGIRDNNIMEGNDIDELNDKDFLEIIDNIKIFARVEPRHKLRIVKLLQQKGEIVAMTGDGVNDAPALKKADVGIAIGSGTEVAKQIADLVLLNDSFSIIALAIEEGRAILDNIRKVITYLLSDSFTEVMLIGGSLIVAKLFGVEWFLPITAVQILWINLVADGFPALALAFEPKEEGLMDYKVTKQEKPLLNKEMKVIIFTIGIITDVILLGMFLYFWQQGFDVAYIRTMIFAVLGFDSLFYIFSCKSLHRSILDTNIFSNKLLILSVIFGLIALLTAIYIPALNLVLGVIPLALSDWVIIVGLGIIEIILVEITKDYFIKRHRT
jgi:P-type Ca2+ transporter type 2C